MAKDPGFKFYPGDYLRDTQNLSANSQVAYDKIMCEHIRNICVTQRQVEFFIKRLNEEERAELFFVLEKIEGGYVIPWIVQSIEKTKAYSQSRSENRSGKTNNTSKSYEHHMDIDNDSDKDNGTNKARKKKFVPPSLDEVKEYFSVNGYTEQTAERAWKGYELNGWKDSNDKQINNWKMKMVQVWFKKEHQINEQSKKESSSDSRSQLKHDAINNLANQAGRTSEDQSIGNT